MIAATPELIALRARVCASPGAFHLLEADSMLPFDDDAFAAGQARFRRMYDSVEDLTHALRGEHLTEEEAAALAAEDRRRWDELIAEDERREEAARKEHMKMRAA